MDFLNKFSPFTWHCDLFDKNSRWGGDESRWAGQWGRSGEEDRSATEDEAATTVAEADATKETAGSGHREESGEDNLKIEKWIF